MNFLICFYRRSKKLLTVLKSEFTGNQILGGIEAERLVLKASQFRNFEQIMISLDSLLEDWSDNHQEELYHQFWTLIHWS